MSGCGQTAPDLNGSNNNISDANAISGDTVSIDESAYGMNLKETTTAVRMVLDLSILILEIMRSLQIWKIT